MIIKIINLTTLLITFSIASISQRFIVDPYIQPGNSPSLSREDKTIIWQTDSIPGKFTLQFNQVGNDQNASSAKVSSKKLHFNGKTTYLYRATLSKLKFDCEYSFQISLNGQHINSGSFNSRSKLSQVKFAVLGDCGAGTLQQAEIAYQIFQQKPQFVLVTGDNVYQNGLAKEYITKFFPYYNSKTASKTLGAPLMKSIPFYLLLGNHDVFGADLEKTNDGLAYFYYNDLPLNGFYTNHSTEVRGSSELVKSFKKNTDSRFPRMSNYSFDYGNVHIACLDANPYVNPLSAELIQWLRDDMNRSKAEWKIVSFHHPGFNSSKAHYDYQQMRLLSPELEKLKVDLVLNGHVHNYQRSLPLTFDPKKNKDGTQYILTEEGRVDGTFTLDENFDGITNTKPKGIIYIVTGAGGAPLYDPSLSGKPDLWKHEPQENWVPFTAKMFSNIHTFTLIETTSEMLTLKQIDAQGSVVDEIKITK
ncbi:MAG: metallophosphoesterase family protein [Cyclobacteriaceae bacterium]|nr:metallophosphoesterase family protein [Cyclobacteriaceae bacterium]